MSRSLRSCRWLWLTVLTIWLSPGAIALGDDLRLPNIILIVADDLGYGELGCYGQHWIKTPNIDRIAQEGIRFTQHYCGQAVCAPSRCSLLTGYHQGHAYIRDNGNPPERQRATKPDELYFPGQYPIPDSSVTIAELLRPAGYATAAIGKWGLGYEGSSGDPNRQGFDLFYGYLCQVHAHNHFPKFLFRNGQIERLEGNNRGATGAVFSQDRFIDVALEFIDQHPRDPFFLYLPFTIPHLSIQAPQSSVDEYIGVIPEADYVHKGYIQHPTPRAGYAAMITHMDRGIGMILDRLAELGIDSDTLILFTSDNGPTYDRLGGSDSDFFQSAGNLRGRKGALLEGGIRVPLVARWPGKIQPGATTPLICAFWDYLPTFCDIAGVPPPTGIDGISFLPTLLGNDSDQQRHKFLYWEFSAYGGQQAIRAGRWKALREGLRKEPHARFQLYDLATDPSESQDVAEQHPDVIAEMQRVAGEAHRNSELFPFPALDTSAKK